VEAEVTLNRHVGEMAHRAVTVETPGTLTIETSGGRILTVSIFNADGENVGNMTSNDVNKPGGGSLAVSGGTYYISFRNNASEGANLRLTANFEHVCAWGEWEEVQGAACDTEGRRERTCGYCPAVDVSVVPASGCNWGEWVTTREPSCTHNGIRERECQNDCGEEELDTISMLECSWSSWVTTRATCIADGNRTRKCTNCDTSEVEVLPATGFGGTGACAECGTTSRQVGDINGNGIVDVNDALAILRYLVGLPSRIDTSDCAMKAALIINPHGDEPTVQDALAVLRHLVGLSSALDD
jgi:hypothetical protein